MKLNQLQFVAQVKKGNMILTTYKNNKGKEFLFAKLTKKVEVVQEVVEVVNTIVEVVEEVQEEVKFEEVKTNKIDMDDFTRFAKWCEEEFGKTPSLKDYYIAKEYYSNYSEVC